MGHYCVKGTRSPEKCPKGTFNNETGGKISDDDCKSCTPGKSCSPGKTTVITVYICL